LFSTHKKEGGKKGGRTNNRERWQKRRMKGGVGEGISGEEGGVRRKELYVCMTKRSEKFPVNVCSKKDSNNNNNTCGNNEPSAHDVVIVHFYSFDNDVCEGLCTCWEDEVCR
jgi:hypothetical protein